MGEKTIVPVAYECGTWAPKDVFFRVKTLKTLFMLSRVPLDLLKCILSGVNLNENFCDSSLHHIFESKNSRTPFSYQK